MPSSSQSGFPRRKGWAVGKGSERGGERRLHSSKKNPSQGLPKKPCSRTNTSDTTGALGSMSEPVDAAPHESRPEQPEVEATISTLLAQNRRTATAFTVTKHSNDAAKNWDKFYKNHADKFFKDRHWTSREFGSAVGSSSNKPEDDRGEETELVSADVAGQGSAVLLEVGCGVGNMLYPLLEANEALRVHCCDFSQRAVDMVRSHPRYDAARVNAFVFDLTSSQPSLASFLRTEPYDAWPAPTTVSLIFVLSAIPPHLHLEVLKSLADLLAANPGGGHILFRDYAYGDLSQVRYHTKKDAAWAEPSLLSDEPGQNWYRRGDNTFNYFFQPHELDALAGKLGLQGEAHLLRRTAVNRKSEVNMQRRFVQAKWFVPPRT